MELLEKKKIPDVNCRGRNNWNMGQNKGRLQKVYYWKHPHWLKNELKPLEFSGFSATCNIVTWTEKCCARLCHPAEVKADNIHCSFLIHRSSHSVVTWIVLVKHITLDKSTVSPLSDLLLLHVVRTGYQGDLSHNFQKMEARLSHLVTWIFTGWDFSSELSIGHSTLSFLFEHVSGHKGWEILIKTEAFLNLLPLIYPALSAMGHFRHLFFLLLNYITFFLPWSWATCSLFCQAMIHTLIFLSPGMDSILSLMSNNLSSFALQWCFLQDLTHQIPMNRPTSLWSWISPLLFAYLTPLRILNIAALWSLQTKLPLTTSRNYIISGHSIPRAETLSPTTLVVKIAPIRLKSQGSEYLQRKVHYAAENVFIFSSFLKKWKK